MATDANECCLLARTLGLRLTDSVAPGIISTTGNAEETPMHTTAGIGGGLGENDNQRCSGVTCAPYFCRRRQRRRAQYGFVGLSSPSMYLQTQNCVFHVFSWISRHRTWSFMCVSNLHAYLDEPCTLRPFELDFTVSPNV